MIQMMVFLPCLFVVCFDVVYDVISLIMRLIRICLMGPESISIMRLIRISMMGLAPHEHFNNYTPNHHPIPWLDSSSFLHLNSIIQFRGEIF